MEKLLVVDGERRKIENMEKTANTQNKAQGFDPKSLVLPQNFAELGAVKKVVLHVPIRKPNKQTWFCPSPNLEARKRVAAIELKDEREIYILTQGICEELLKEWVPMLLVPCQTLEGGAFYWYIRLPDAAGNHNSWHASALEIADNYGTRWIRIASNKEVGGYDVISPISPHLAPEWGDEDLLWEKACKGHVINSHDHRIIKQLRGEA